MNGASVHMGLGHLQESAQFPPGKSSGLGLCPWAGSSWGDLGEQWSGQARDTVEICHQHLLPPKKGGPELPLNGPQCSSCTTTTPASPPTPLDPEARAPGARSLLGRQAGGGTPHHKASFICAKGFSYLREEGGSFLSPPG